MSQNKTRIKFLDDDEDDVDDDDDSEKVSSEFSSREGNKNEEWRETKDINECSAFHSLSIYIAFLSPCVYVFLASKL